jgi:hypothetical protein
MNDWKLPADLQRLEDELMALPRPMLPASLRAGMDRDMRERLRGERRRSWYGYVAAAAAALLWANLSLRAASATNFQLAAQRDRSNAAALEEQLRELVPELDARERHRQVVVFQTDAYLVPRPADALSAGRSSPLRAADTDKSL